MQEFISITSALLILTGAIFMLIASIGMIRLPDFFIRISVLTKASTIGLGFMLVGIALYFNHMSIFLKVTFMLVFIVLTSPVSAHIISKAASHIRIPFWEKTDLQDYLKADETPDDPKTKKSSYGGRKKNST